MRNPQLTPRVVLYTFSNNRFAFVSFLAGIKADNWDEPMTRKNVEMIIELYEATAETDLIQGINL